MRVKKKKSITVALKITLQNTHPCYNFNSSVMIKFLTSLSILTQKLQNRPHYHKSEKYNY
jgi:hypothetical protein